MIKEEIQEQEFIKKLDVFLKGNIEAIKFCHDLVAMIHIWDDLVDKDKEITDDDINNAFRVALVDIPLNPFYNRYREHLIPLIMNCILQWEDSNKMEKGELQDKHQAFILKASVLQIISYCAFIIGGIEWSRKVGVDIRRMYEEKLEDIIKEE